MVVDLSKTPPRFFLACGMYCAFAAFIPCILAGLSIWGFYFKRHPEYTKETTFRYPLSAPKK